MVETIKSLQWIYAVILALAINEAFKEFVKAGNDTCNGSSKKKNDIESLRAAVRLDCLGGLLALLLLVIPFYQGMNAYLNSVYTPFCTRPAWGWFLADVFIFYGRSPADLRPLPQSSNGQVARLLRVYGHPFVR